MSGQNDTEWVMSHSVSGGSEPALFHKQQTAGAPPQYRLFLQLKLSTWMAPQITGPEAGVQVGWGKQGAN